MMMVVDGDKSDRSMNNTISDSILALTHVTGGMGGRPRPTCYNATVQHPFSPHPVKEVDEWTKAKAES